MEKYRRIILLAALAVLLVMAPRGLVYATGGDSFDAPAPSLGDSLDFLPAKSLGEIFLETTAPASDKEPPDFDEEVLKLSERLRTRTGGAIGRCRRRSVGAGAPELLQRRRLVQSSPRRARCADGFGREQDRGRGLHQMAD